MSCLSASEDQLDLLLMATTASLSSPFQVFDTDRNLVLELFEGRRMCIRTSTPRGRPAPSCMGHRNGDICGLVFISQITARLKE